ALRSARAYVLSVIFLAMNMPAFAEAPPTQGQSTNGDGVSGLIINQTMSSIGQQFFLNFTEFWRDKPGGEHYTLDIVERPSRRFGNQVIIMYGQKSVYLAALPIRLDKVRALSELAVETTYANIVSINLFGPTMHDPDMSNDEL
ncbi:MAG: CsgE family curli-type amyloid fiber assembly protein, partial [Burkholderiales bacterium]